MKKLQPILKSGENKKIINEPIEAIDEEPEVKPKCVPVIKPIDEHITFESIDDFTNYYNEHKEELDPLSTCKLNKMFKIIVDDEPYKISKIKGELSLRTIPKSRVTAIMRIEELENTQNEIIDKINALIELINSSVQI